MSTSKPCIFEINRRCPRKISISGLDKETLDFAEHGEVLESKIVIDKISGQLRIELPPVVDHRPTTDKQVHAIASSSSSSSDIVDSNPIHFILQFEDFSVVECASSASRHRVLAYDTGYDCFSVSDVVSDRFLFLVGGCDENDTPPQNVRRTRTRNVFYIDLTQSYPHPINQGPSLISPKWLPSLVCLGTKLFAFSLHFYSVCPDLSTEPEPFCEVLDISSPDPSCWSWSPFTSFPKLPSPDSIRRDSYSLVCFAVNDKSQSIFMSFGSEHGRRGYSFCYNDSSKICSNPRKKCLPFFGQGKFVDDFCFGFPWKKNNDRDYYNLVRFKLEVNWRKNKNVYWVKLDTFSLSSGSSVDTFLYVSSFYPIRETVFAFARVIIPSWDNDCENLVEIDVLELLADEKEEITTSNVVKILPDGSRTQIVKKEMKRLTKVLSHCSYRLHIAPLAIFAGSYRSGDLKA